jgi:GT2 family glycosyltransferase
MYQIAVLLTSFNRKEKTLSCLRSLNKITEDDPNVNVDIYLVDDNSMDGTSQSVRDNFENVILIMGTGQLFWNRGMNLAWSEASKKSYDYYLWLNDDTILKDKAIEILVNDSKLFNNDAIICGVCESRENGEVTYGGYKKDTHEIIHPIGKPQYCFFFNGNIVLVPKSVFRILGNLDPVFHHSLGDFDYGLRAYKKGIKTYITSQIIGYCEKNELTKWCNPKYKFKERIKTFYSPLGAVPFQQFIFLKRHYGYFKAFTTFFSNHLRLIFPSKWLR